MPRLGQGGNLRDVEASTGSGGGCLPEGWYRFMISGSEYKATKSREGMCLHLTLACLEISHQGFEVRDFLTLEHPSQQATEINRATLKAIALAVNHPNPDQIGDSDELHQVPMMVRLYVESHEKYGDQNRVGAYMSVKAHREKFGNGQAAAPAPTQASRPPSDEPPAHSDEDVPF